MFSKILIANRGEIAVRVIRACREMGISTVAVYSEADREALHVRLADEACAIGPPAPRASYLSIDRIIEAAKITKADAIHPGYGFLSENPLLPEACEAAGIVFIGPSAASMRLMGNKVSARQTMIETGVPVTPGTGILPEDPEAARRIVEETMMQSARESAPVSSDEDAIRSADPGANSKGSTRSKARQQKGRAAPTSSGQGVPGGDLGSPVSVRNPYPVLLKAAAGGGGKGMRVVASAEAFASAFEQARSEASSSFGDASVYAERFVTRPRHIEVQILADHLGNTVHLGERECSIQRRHQKLIEECPSPVVDPATRERLGELAVRAAKAAGYAGAGTCEFLRDEDGSYYFMEMNARLQVEHPVTEMVTGLDLVQLQIRIAAGEQLPFGQEDVVLRGWAIECRISAENPARGFMPSPGRIGTLRVPAGPGIRDDGGVYQGYRVPIHYDPMISKLIAWASTREEAIARMRRALDEYRIEGIRTTIPFHRRVMRHPAFLAGDLDTHFIETYKDELIPKAASAEQPAAPADVATVLPAARVDSAVDSANGRPLSSREVAVIAAAIAVFRKAEASAMGTSEEANQGSGAGGPGAGAWRAPGGRAGGWKLASRLEGLRDR